MTADTPEMKHWLWFFGDDYGPWFGIVTADSRQAADRLVRARLADECRVPADIFIQECEDNFTMAKGYL